jgi:hypothetical protein
MRFEILPGLPPYGPPALSFTKNGPREHREGLVVRFHPERSEPWVGNFLGGDSACNTVLDHPNGIDVVVVAQGEACAVDVEGLAIREIISSSVQEVWPLPLMGSIVFRELTDFMAIRADGTGWRSPQISWDGFRDIELHGDHLSGEAYTPLGDQWVPFTLNLLTGDCFDRIYETDMRRAKFIKAREL